MATKVSESVGVYMSGCVNRCKNRMSEGIAVRKDEVKVFWEVFP